MGAQIDLAALGERLRKTRQSRHKTLRDVFQETGVSIPTLSRIERGDANEIESNTLFAITKWIDVSIDTFSPAPPTSKIKKGVSTPDVVELHLRADKNLNSKTAATLSKMFRALYEELSEEMSRK